MNFQEYPRVVVEDIIRLRRRMEKSQLPIKRVDHNLLIGTWNLRMFSRIHEKWEENAEDPKRNLRAMAYIAEIVKRFDVIAIQEVRSNTSAIRTLINGFLGSNWDLLVSDVSAGSGGNAERLAFIFDRRRVQLSGLAGEIVLPPAKDGNPMLQFDRTPYIVGFRSMNENFSLLTAHIKYGKVPTDRLGELTALAGYIATEIRNKVKEMSEENNLIVLGDFNIDDRGENPLFKAFVSTGLIVPDQLLNLRTTYDTKPKYYDQIAWFMSDMGLIYDGRAGVIDFAGAIYKELSPKDMSYRVSDHFPLWVEFMTDRSTEVMARTLGVDPNGPNPFEGVPD